MVIDDVVLAVQRGYPQIYLACHKEHVRARSNRWQLSSHDSAILSHLDKVSGVAPKDLGRHLQVAASSLSASLKRLEQLGYISNLPAAADRRRREIRLTDEGVEAIQGTSVLDTRKLRLLIQTLTEDERQKAVDGLTLLARAAGSINVDHRVEEQ
jgi:DNA-binding MarR family transcriptional regulator